MLSPWLNQTVKVQRRAANPSRNALNEPNYGAESAYTTVYPSVPCRIEYVPETVQWTETGERVNPSASGTFIYFEPEFVIMAQDRITILESDDISLVNKLYIVIAIFAEWSAMGFTHHRVAQIAVH